MMKCLILAAGYATRLYPLTKNFPKPLLKVGDKAILDWLIDDIASAALIEEYVVISNHRYAAAFEGWAQKRQEHITVLDDGTSTNETRLGAVRDIQFAIEQFQLADDLLIIAGDNVLDFSLTSFIRYALTKGTSCIMRYYESSEERLKRCGVVKVNECDLVLSMEEKPAHPQSHWCCPPFYFYAKNDVHLVQEGIAAGCKTDAPGSFIAWLCTHSPVHAMEMPGKRYDIGNPASYNQVLKEYKGITR